MRQKIIFYFILLVFSKTVFSQQRDVTIRYQVNPNGDVIFQGNNLDYCDYFATMTFTQLSNATVGSTMQVSVPPGTSQIFKLTPVRANEPISFGFSYSYIKGNSNPKINSSFLYLLPVKEGKETKVDLILNLKEFLGKPVPENWYALSCTMDVGDTIYASRGGVVCKINGAGNITSNTGTVYTRSTNSVEIYHSDGSFGKYDLLKNEGILVKAGEKVNAGDPIGIIGKVYDKVYTSFLVYYLDKKLITTNGSFLTAGYSSAKPKFALSEKAGDHINPGETYAAIKPINVVTQEMSKKEREKFQTGSKK